MIQFCTFFPHTLVTQTPLMCMSDCRGRCPPELNWVTLSCVGVSCTAATCWLKCADITCSHRISTVVELFAASRFRFEPHWNGRSEWTFPAYYRIVQNFPFITMCKNAGPHTTWSWRTFPSISVGVWSFHKALVSPLPAGCSTIFHMAMRPWLVPAAKISEDIQIQWG